MVAQITLINNGIVAQFTINSPLLKNSYLLNIHHSTASPPDGVPLLVRLFYLLFSSMSFLNCSLD